MAANSFHIGGSVTRFGKVLKASVNFFEGLVSYWHKIKPTLANFVCNWADFRCCKSLNIERKI